MIAHVVPDKPSAMRRSGKNPAPNNLRKAIRPCPEVVLLAVTGMSPAILTETVWALAQENPPVLPDRIVVLTTTAGKEQIEQELFTPQTHFNNQSGWDCLREKLQEHGHEVAGRLRFDPATDDLRVLHRWDEKSHRKPALSDIRTAGENDAVADYILEVLRTFVENADTRVIACRGAENHGNAALCMHDSNWQGNRSANSRAGQRTV
jgi:CRISPR-associated protein NE0113 (Cas_NE0113)